MKFLRRNWALLLAFLLIPLVGLLAALQLAWIGDMGDRERIRLRQGLFASAGELALAIQREILLAPWTLAHREDAGAGGASRSGSFTGALASGDWTFFSARRDNWKALALDPDILAAIHLIAAGKAPGPTVLTWKEGRFSPEPADALAGDILGAVDGTEGGSGLPRLFRRGAEEWELLPVPGEKGLVLLLRFDLSVLSGMVLPRLAVTHLEAMTDYRFRVLDRSTGAVLYRGPEDTGKAAAKEGGQPPPAEPDDSDFDQPDMRLGLFRQDFIAPGLAERDLSPYTTRSAAPVLIFRASRQTGEAALRDLGDRDALWILEAVHRGGSLASVVRASTIRSTVASLGILLLLGAALVVLAFANRRSSRLAARQEEFIAAVTHELKTPLAVIGTAAENLSDGIVREPAALQRYGSTIRKESLRLASMIDKLLFYARLGSAQAPGRERVDLSDLAREVLAEKDAELAALGFRVEASFPETPVAVPCDPTALRHVLLNLVSNVIVHASAGGYLGIIVTIEPPRKPSDPGRAVIRVDDRGPGIPRRERKAVFEAFFRGRRARDNQEPGSGIGLNLVRRVVQAHGGSVRLDSNEGFGTSLSIRLPLSAAAPLPGPEDAHG